MSKKVYAEIGFGNESFLSTEIEEEDKEYRIKHLILPKKIKGFYFRFWILTKVLIISTNEGIKFQKKNQNKIKILFGIQGE